jgi:hypothetical protein
LKLGQPVPLSNFSLDANNGWLQAAHENLPGLSFWRSSGTRLFAIAPVTPFRI